jgi:hypothetical protein
MPKKEGAKKVGGNAQTAAGGGKRGAGKAAPETLGTEASGLQAARSGSRRNSQSRSDPPAQSSGQLTDAVSMLKADHRKVEEIFARFEKARDGEKAQLVQEACEELVIHTMLEEQVFYPATRRPDTDDLLDEAQVEHDTAKVLIVELMEGDDSDEFREAKFKVLMEAVKLHINEEEAPDGVMDRAQKSGVNTPQIARRLAQLKQRLQEQAQKGGLPEPQPVSFQYFGQHEEDDRRPRLYHGAREERGVRSYSRDEGEDRYERRSHGRGGWDERARGAHRDRDEGYGRQGQGRGGWYGDPEGHSAAARRGWDERDDQGRAYRRPDDDRDQRGGWYGDPEGHAEAARRGWDEREERSYARRRDDDDDDDEREPRGRGYPRGRY